MCILPAHGSARSIDLFRQTAHRKILTRSLAVLSGTLHKGMYTLDALGTAIDDVQVPDHDPPAASRYSCVYWIELRKLWGTNHNTNTMNPRCVSCNRNFTSNEALQQHRRESSTHKFDCTACDRHFSNNRVLAQHN